MIEADPNRKLEYLQSRFDRYKLMLNKLILETSGMELDDWPLLVRLQVDDFLTHVVLEPVIGEQKTAEFLSGKNLSV